MLIHVNLCLFNFKEMEHFGKWSGGGNNVCLLIDSILYSRIHQQHNRTRPFCDRSDHGFVSHFDEAFHYDTSSSSFCAIITISSTAVEALFCSLITISELFHKDLKSKLMYCVYGASLIRQASLIQ